ncbi:hypothetical protein [Pararhizobium sp.]|uniref:hypothetical protein n=1 Tax=Pararhizobium sp. TaxID=1977563 RepID=UPI003BA870BA
MQIPAPTHEPGEMQRTMECEELIHPLIDTIVSAAVVSGWAIDEALIAVEEAVKDIRAAKPAAG